MQEVTVQDAVIVGLTEPVYGEKRLLDATLTFRLTQEDYDGFVEAAEKDGRSLSSFFRKLLSDSKASAQEELDPTSIAALAKDVLQQREETWRSTSPNPYGRQLADGMPIRVWLAGHILAGNQICPTNVEDPAGFAKDVLRVADAIEAEAFKDA